MSGATIADALVVTFTRAVGLADWEREGLLEREWALYERLRARVGRVVLATHGASGERAIAQRLGPGVEVVACAPDIDEARGATEIPARVADAVGPSRRVVVKTNQMDGGLLAVAIGAALREAGREVGLVARGGYPWSRFEAWEHGPDSAPALASAEREGRLCREADVVVGTTRGMVEDLAWRHGLPRDRLAVVPNYVCAPGAETDEAREPFTILWAGRLVRQKRVDRLIDAVALLPGSLRELVTLRLVGSGPLEAELRARGAAAGLRVEFEPRMAHAQLLERMRRCAVYAQASDYEGHPKTVLEAMASGCPVAVCATPGLGETVRDGVTGLLAEPTPGDLAAALQRLLEDPAFARRLGRAGGARVRDECGLERIVEREAEVYRSALARGAGRGQGSGPIDAGTAVRWDPALPGATHERSVEAWSRSVRAFARRLPPRERARFALALDDPLYKLQGEAAVEAEGGLHPKHRLMRYHDFFTERVSAGERVIDLGSGVGALAASIAERAGGGRGARVVGVDWSEASVERSRRLGAERGLAARLEFLLGDIREVRAEGRFDAVVLSNVLEHLESRPGLLRRWREWYEPARFLVRVPAIDREWRVPYKRELGVEWRLDPTHDTEYTESQLRSELAQAGLRITELVARWGEYWARAEPA